MVDSFDSVTDERLDVHNFFPGNYRWSYNTLFAFAAGGELGDVSMVVDRLMGQDGDDEAWIREWAWLADILEHRATANIVANASISAAENLFYPACTAPSESILFRPTIPAGQSPMTNC